MWISGNNLPCCLRHHIHQQRRQRVAEELVAKIKVVELKNLRQQTDTKTGSSTAKQR